VKAARCCYGVLGMILLSVGCCREGVGEKGICVRRCVDLEKVLIMGAL